MSTVLKTNLRINLMPYLHVKYLTNCVKTRSIKYLGLKEANVVTQTQQTIQKSEIPTDSSITGQNKGKIVAVTSYVKSRYSVKPYSILINKYKICKYKIFHIDAVISLSTKDKTESPMDQLLKEELELVHKKEIEKENSWNLVDHTKVDKKDNLVTTNLGKEIQSVTGEHYLKAEDKSDITALQENDTTIAHASKVTSLFLVQLYLTNTLEGF